MKKLRLYLLVCLLIFLGASCSPSEKTSLSGGNGSTRPQLNGLSRDQLANYSATTEIQFQGPTHWIYQLKTRKSPDLREESLHIEGIATAKNPGDIRLVTDGKTTWMIGPGTDNECVQFPNNQGMDPTFIYPETLVTMQDLNNLLGYMGEEPILGQASQHYGRSDITIGQWKNAQVDVWQDRSSQALFRFILQASGDDSIFATGAGSIKMNYAITDFSPGTIQPVEGCQISVPMPDSAQKYVRLPGMASFETPAGMEELIRYYQGVLPGQKWTEKEPLAQDGASAVLSYSRDTENIEIHIEAAPGGGNKVKILWITSAP